MPHRHFLFTSWRGRTSFFSAPFLIFRVPPCIYRFGVAHIPSCRIAAMSCIACSQVLSGASTRWLTAYRSPRQPWRVLCDTPSSSWSLFATLLLIVPATCDVFRLPCTVRGYEVVLVHLYMRFTKAVHAILNVCTARKGTLFAGASLRAYEIRGSAVRFDELSW